MTSYKITKLGEYKDAILYRIICECTDSSCDTEMILEFDKEIGDITLTFYKDLKYCSWWRYGENVFWKTLEKVSKGINNPLQDKEGIIWEFLEKITYNFHELIWDYWKRITGCLRLLFTGKIQLEEHTMIMNDDHILDFIHALHEGRTKLKEFEKEWKSQQSDN